MVTDKFLAREKKALLVKISKYLSKRLTEIKDRGEIQDIEIMQITGWTNTRISEIRNYDKYQIRIPEKHLTALIMKGIITVSELKRNLDRNVKESEYIDSLRVYEIIRKNPKLAAILIKYEDSDKDPAKILLENLE